MKLVIALAILAPVAARKSEVWTREQEDAAGIVHTGLGAPAIFDGDVPEELNWCDKDGVN